MKIASSSQMRQIDNTSIYQYNIPSIILMENAGIKAVSLLKERFWNLREKKVAIFCGKGNNGGDGLVVARHLYISGIETKVYLLAKKRDILGDALTNLKIAEKLGIPVLEIIETKDLAHHKNGLLHRDIYVDAIFGTGFSRVIKGVIKDIVEFINIANKFILSIDIPSGMNPDKSYLPGNAVKSDLTVTFGLPKPGLIFFPAAANAGEVIVANIGFPPELINSDKIETETIKQDRVLKILTTPRKIDSHKGDYGHSLVIAGSTGKGGAAALASTAILRTGGGLVTLGIPNSISLSFETGVKEVMTKALPQTKEGSIGVSAFTEIKKIAGRMDVMLLGPGITTHDSTKKLVIEIIKNITVPLVVDADGINCISKDPSVLLKKRGYIILTPHLGEMSRLTGRLASDIQKDRIGTAREFSLKYKVFTILKGARTIIATPKGYVYVNMTGNPGMATAGSGDVLSGVITGLISQGYDVIDALLSSIYLHGLAGDIAKEEYGEMGVIASDLITYMPKAINAVKTRSSHSLVKSFKTYS